MSKPVLILILSTLLSCNQAQKHGGIKTEAELSNLESAENDFVILTYKSEWWWIFINANPAELDSIEIKRINLLVEDAVRKNNEERKNSVDVVNSHLDRKAIERTGFELDLSKYKRHYVPILNDRGEKEIWINFFCHHREDYNWRKDLVIVADGGSCYFNLKINLTKEQYYDLRINVIA